MWEGGGAYFHPVGAASEAAGGEPEGHGKVEIGRGHLPVGLIIEGACNRIFKNRHGVRKGKGLDGEKVSAGGELQIL